MYDVLIIGAGPAGLTAGLFAASYGLKTVVIGEIVGGQFTLAPMAFNYPGVAGVTGKGWIDAMLNQLKEVGVEVVGKKVIGIKNQESGIKENKKSTFEVKGEDSTFSSSSLILATGNKRRRPAYSGDIVAQSLGIITSNGYITVDEHFATNVLGVFAAGDCLGYPQALEQLVVVCGQGVKAAASAYSYLKGAKPPIVWGKASIPRV